MPARYLKATTMDPARHTCRGGPIPPQSSCPTKNSSGQERAKGRDKRPAFYRLCKAVTRRKIDVVAAWSVDRLGRSLQDLVGFLGELNGAGCDLYLERQAVDTTTPAGRALFQMLVVRTRQMSPNLPFTVAPAKAGVQSLPLA
jgi:hypothetical protein